MQKLVIRRPVIVNVIMTEQFRKELLTDIQARQKKLEEDIKSLEIGVSKEIARRALTEPKEASLLTRQLESDKERLTKLGEDLIRQMETVNNIPEGQEVPFWTLDGWVEIGVGDDLRQKTTQTQIVIKDWQVVEVRNP